MSAAGDIASVAEERRVLRSRKTKLLDEIRAINMLLDQPSPPLRRASLEMDRQKLVGEGKRIDHQIGKLNERLRKLHALLPQAQPRTEDEQKQRLWALFQVAYYADQYLYAETEADDDRYGNLLERALETLEGIAPGWSYTEREAP